VNEDVDDTGHELFRNKPSKLMRKTRFGAGMVQSDGDVWVEKVLKHRDSGEMKSFFFSQNTGFYVPDEPPSGASNIVYLIEN
jgi:hypothetical protein